MSRWPQIEDFSGFVRELLSHYDAETVSEFTNTPVEQLQAWSHGAGHSTPQDEWLLFGFCLQYQRFDMLERYSDLVPTYDTRSLVTDLTKPPLGYNAAPPDVQLHSRPTRLGGLFVNFPFGISASILTRNYETIKFYAARGFEILTYKTVRSERRVAHPAPNWVFVHTGGDQRIAPPFDAPVIGDPDYWPPSPKTMTTANSFGIPSLDPEEWMLDVERATNVLRTGQILIVSVVASPPFGDDREQTLVDDFVRVALDAKEAGAQIVEANYSCPNTPNDPAGFLYQDAELAGRVSRALRRALGDTPLFVKIGYLELSRLQEFVKYNAGFVQGIVAINTISMPVRSASSYGVEPVFSGPGRENAGVSGDAIKPWAMEVVRNLAAMRHGETSFDILAVGGVGSAEDVRDYLNLGATAVACCTAAYLNPLIAIETRLKLMNSKNGGGVPTITERPIANYTSAGPEIIRALQREGGELTYSDLILLTGFPYGVIREVVEILAANEKVTVQSEQASGLDLILLR